MLVFLEKTMTEMTLRMGILHGRGGSGVITDFLEREALLQKKFLNR